MNIGIDFDNTIAFYDKLFISVAISKQLIDKEWKIVDKTELRDYLLNQPDGEKSWMKLQGLVYGKEMHGAEMMPGVANFLMSCNVRKHRVFIVSHKTEYGHFDPEKIPLRDQAMKWMETNYFFDSKYFGLDKNNIFFGSTREEKVNIIDHLNCDWFIDDLPEVFEENDFPNSTQKILFGSFKPDQFHDKIVLNSWRKISGKILGRITDQDIIFWADAIVDSSIKNVKKIPGRGNATIYKVDVSRDISYALKYYPDQFIDSRPRLETEFKALEILYEHGIKNIPQPIKKNYDLNLGLYEWINGKHINEPSFDDLEQAIRFAKRLCSLSQIIDSKDINFASEACLSANALISQIENRLFRLKGESKHFQELSTFLNSDFVPLWAEIKNYSYSLWPQESREINLQKDKQILSPSDFGFHNSLQSQDGVLTFFDFDYFGWDDPVKFTADFLWHPAMNLNINFKKRWQEAMIGLFNSDSSFEDRLNAAMPLYGLRWALIILNEFLPDVVDRRKEAGKTEIYSIDKTRKIQLNKAQYYCEKVKSMVF